jgi:GAF domain-containing protein/HAMP domain-containing protein
MVFTFIQRQVRNSIITTQLEIMRDHARIYSARTESEPNKEQSFAEDMANTANGDVFFLIARNGTYLAHSNPVKVGHSALEDFSFDTLQKLLARETTTILDEKKGILIGSYRTTLTNSLAVSVGNVGEKTAELNTLTRSILVQLFSALILVSFAAGAAVLSILRPLVKLANYATEVSHGNFNAKFDDRQLSGELAVLSSSIKSLTLSAQSAILSLENRVSTRTHELEHRSILLKAVADVGKAITSFRSLSELLQQTTYLINENFGYYHIGIFLLDEHKEYAVLAATNSEGGLRMLENNHQLKISETSIVGFVTLNAKARIALDVGKDASFFDNPYLPKTRSEMALPLVVGGQILGALDVQSTESQAFSEEDVATLQILAEQLAVAIQNVNLINETEKALEAARMVYGEISREAWGKILRNQPRIGYLSTPPGTIQMHSEIMEPNLAKAFETGDVVLGSDNLTISVPIKVRGQSIGAIRLKKSEIAEAWTQDETNLAIALSDQLSGALESARLYRESQQRAARESLVSDISARISAVSHTDAILRETVQELGQTLGNASVTFQLLDTANEQEQASSSTNRSGKNPVSGKNWKIKE